ncbi:hypothetical protein EJ07DRAFT_178621 [Lizonia empirigonia]|nr:hypothetical protein EJ07DRAFT_178621 [Lizonia empirigonia]
MAELAVFDKDPNIYLFTSLTAGSSHIITATSRIETILKANKIPFIGLDTATHELGRKLFQRRAAGKKLPLLVKEGYVLGGIEDIEEWNEYDELREALAPSKTPPPLAGALPGGFSFGSFGGGSNAKENTPVASSEQNLAIRQMGAEAAKIAASKKPAPVKISTTNPLLTEKTNANSPADILSPKSTPLPRSSNTTTTDKTEGGAKKLPAVELPSILSPRSTPLPPTPGAAPKLEQQKPVHAPPSMRDDAANPALSAGPIKTTQAKEESSEEDSDEEESSEESTPSNKVEKTQEQDPKDAGKAGASVKEGEQEEESSEDESEDLTEAGAEDKKTEPKSADGKSATQKAETEQSSNEETGDDEDDESEEEVKIEHVKDDVKNTQTQDPKDASKAGESVSD